MTDERTETGVDAIKRARHEVVQLQPRDIVPTSEDLFPGTKALAVHSITDFLVTADPDLDVRVATYYESRAITHHWAVRPGDTLFIQASDRTNARAVQAYDPLYREVTGIALVPVVDLHEAGLAEDGIAYVPYYPAPHYSDLSMYGIDPEQAAALRNKSRFADTVRELNGELADLAIEEDVYGNLVLPHVLVENAADLPQAVSDRAAEIDKMYADVRRAMPDFHYPVGLVIQDLGGDGGYGTMYLSQVEDGWRVSGSGTGDGTYVTFDEAVEALRQSTSQSTSQYKIARQVDKQASPSVHVYVDRGKVVSMPVTFQLMEDDSCIGGGSENAVAEGIEVRPNERRLMRRASEYVMSRTLTDQSRAGMVCFDYITAGQKEDTLREAVLANDELKALYGQEVIQKGHVECNPRHTSISGAAWPAITAMVHARMQGFAEKHPGEPIPNELRAVTYEDVQTMYGQPNSRGEVGAFFTFDKIHVPDDVTTEEQLVSWIRQFNNGAQRYGIYMLPRIRLHLSEEGGHKTSIILGMLPQGPGEVDARLEVFQDIIMQLRATQDLSTLL